jgi:hypothetical protein
MYSPPPKRAECLAMQVIEPTTRSRATAWVITVLLFSLPSVIFVILQALYAPAMLPGFLDLVVVWTITVTGMVGFLLTLAACVVAVVATFQKQVPRAANMVMWVLVLSSFLACLYLSRTPL